jgi:AcrR family transcriptional regulator
MTSARRPVAKAKRTDRRKAQTRAALIAAAQHVLATDSRAEVSIQQLTDAADVGLGSFYNHFPSRDALFDAAIEDMLETHGAMVDRVTAPLKDPAEVYVVGVRLTGRLARSIPSMARLMVNTGLTYATSQRVLAPRALRDLKAAIAAGRFHVADPVLMQGCVGGAILGLLQHLAAHPRADAGAATDVLARALLRMLGMTAREADALVARPLPRAVR